MGHVDDMAPPYPPYRKRNKREICDEFVQCLARRGDVNVDAPGFVESLRQHFDRLPTRYALDVNLDTLDVLSHQRLLEEARADPSTVSFAVRAVEIIKHPRGGAAADEEAPPSPSHEVCGEAGGQAGRQAHIAEEGRKKVSGLGASTTRSVRSLQHCG